MDISWLVLCGLLWIQVAASIDFVPSAAITSNAALSSAPVVHGAPQVAWAPASSTASMKEPTPFGVEGPREGENAFGHKENVTSLSNGSFVDLGIRNGGSKENPTLVGIDGVSNDSVVADQLPVKEGNFDIILGGTFPYDSDEESRGDGDKELINSKINDNNVLMYPDMFAFAGLKTLDDVVADASRVENESRIKKRQVNVEGPEQQQGRNTSAEDEHLALVRARVISVLDGRTLEEVINDKHTMRRLMPLLRQLRGRASHAGVRVDDETKSITQLEDGSQTSPENSRPSVSVEPSPPGGSATRDMGDEGETLGDSYKINVTDIVEMKGTPESAVNKHVDEAVNETFQEEIGYGRVDQGDTTHENDTSSNSSVPGDGGGGNYSHSTVSESDVENTEGRGYSSNESDVDEAKNPHSSEESHHKRDKAKKRKNPEKNHTDQLNKSKTITADDIGGNGFVQHILRTEGQNKSFEMENGTKPYINSSSRVDQAVNGVIGEQSELDAASIGKGSVDSEESKRGVMNSTTHTNVLDVETNVQDNIAQENHLVEKGLNNSNISTNHEIEEHSEKHRKEKEHKKNKKHRHLKYGELTRQTLNESGGKETLTNNHENKEDKLVGSSLGEVLKSVSIYEVHGNVGQINIKTDSIQDTLGGNLYGVNNNSSELGRELDVNGTVHEKSVDTNVSSEQLHMNQTTDKTSEQVIDHIAQRNYTSNILEKLEQIHITKPGRSSENSLWRKPYFQLLGYTKPVPTLNSASNQTENKNETVTNQVEHDNQLNALTEEKGVGDEKINDVEMFENELLEYAEQDISREEFKRENDTTDDLSRVDEDDESQYSKDDDARVEFEKSDDKQSSGNEENKDSNSDEDDAQTEDNDSENSVDDKEDSVHDDSDDDSEIDTDDDDKEDNEGGKDEQRRDNKIDRSEYDTEGNDTMEGTKSGSANDEPRMGRNESSSSEIIGLPANGGNKTHRVKRIRHRGRPINGTLFQNGLRIRKFRNGTFGKNGTGLGGKKLFKMRREYAQRFNKNGTDLMARIQNGTNLPERNGFRVRRIYIQGFGTNGTRYHHGFKRIKVHRTSNDTSVNLIDSLVQNHTLMNDTNNGDSAASFNQTMERNESLHQPEPYVREESRPMANTMTTSQDHSPNLVGNESMSDGKQDSHESMKLNLTLPETTSASNNIGLSIFNTNNILIFFEILLTLNVIS